MCAVHCGRNVNKPSAPTEIEGKGLKLWCDIKGQQKTSEYIKLKRILMIWLSGHYGKYNSNIFLFHLLGPSPSKMMRMPLNSLFWSPPTAVHGFDAWDMAVPGLYISCVNYHFVVLPPYCRITSHICSQLPFLGPGTTFSKIVNWK